MPRALPFLAILVPGLAQVGYLRRATTTEMLYIDVRDLSGHGSHGAGFEISCIGPT